MLVGNNCDTDFTFLGISVTHSSSENNYKQYRYIYISIVVIDSVIVAV